MRIIFIICDYIQIIDKKLFFKLLTNMKLIIDNYFKTYYILSLYWSKFYHIYGVMPGKTRI